ncbi:SusE outer membrane protein [Flaviramulus basaltis]|uniref:SusE outer membrane protein n=1 Tax=Flaviramulus basaltis TaxID=369401 RepID=A0A1K2INX5_9FLAO|nr:hypothetical protein [Flaviramulus basaltis]SFZ94079.1 SusE outer membrane protein [Flaviramulus basaltis]
MKKIFLLALCINILLVSCNNDDGIIPEEQVPNTAPTTPILSYPTNNLVCIENAINFQWSPSTDAEDNVPIYDLQIATDVNFTEGLNTVSTIANSKLITLEKGLLYYWRISARDTKDATSDYSEVFNFYTEGTGIINHLPFAPVLVSPELNSEQSGNSTSLKWSVEDADGDSLTYDVYFGNNAESLDKIASDITENEYNADLTVTGEYFWKVLAKDGKGGTTVGQLWNFIKE